MAWSAGIGAAMWASWDARWNGHELRWLQAATLALVVVLVLLPDRLQSVGSRSIRLAGCAVAGQLVLLPRVPERHASPVWLSGRTAFLALGLVAFAEIARTYLWILRPLFSWTPTRAAVRWHVGSLLICTCWLGGFNVVNDGYAPPGVSAVVRSVMLGSLGVATLTGVLLLAALPTRRRHAPAWAMIGVLTITVAGYLANFPVGRFVFALTNVAPIAWFAALTVRQRGADVEAPLDHRRVIAFPSPFTQTRAFTVATGAVLVSTGRPAPVQIAAVVLASGSQAWIATRMDRRRAHHARKALRTAVSRMRGDLVDGGVVLRFRAVRRRHDGAVAGVHAVPLLLADPRLQPAAIAEAAEAAGVLGDYLLELCERIAVVVPAVLSSLPDEPFVVVEFPRRLLGVATFADDLTTRIGPHDLTGFLFALDDPHTLSDAEQATIALLAGHGVAFAGRGHATTHHGSVDEFDFLIVDQPHERGTTTPTALRTIALRAGTEVERDRLLRDGVDYVADPQDSPCQSCAQLLASIEDTPPHELVTTRPRADTEP